MRSRRPARRAVAVATAVVGTAAGLLVAASPAAAANYTHDTTTNQGCHVFSNYPKSGVVDYGWDVGPNATLGVRYTFGGYALIKDSARSSLPLHWGFISQGCLNDPYAYNNDFTQRLGDQQGVGGDGSVEYVELAPTPGAEADVIHVTSPGTLRDNPESFAIGNVQTGDAFTITTSTCGTHEPASWIYGRDANSGRWGYVQATHFSACT